MASLFFKSYSSLQALYLAFLLVGFLFILPSSRWPTAHAEVSSSASPEPSHLPLSLPLAGLAPETPTQVRAYLAKAEPLAIDLAAVLSLVEAQNLALSNQRLEAAAARSQTGLAVADLLPDVILSYDQNRFQGGVQIFGGQVVNIYRTTYQPQVAISWTVHPFGRDVVTLLAAKQGAEALEASVNATHQEQLALAATGYYQLLEAELNLAVAQNAVKTAEAQLAETKARFEAGVLPKLEVMRSEALLARREQDVLTAETSRFSLEQALLERLNLEPTITLQVSLAEAAQRFLVPAQASPEELLASALEQNPVIKRFEREIGARKSQHTSAKLASLPEVQMTTFLNGTGPQLDELALTRYGGFRVEMNLLSGLGTRRYFDIREKRERWQQAQVQAQQARRTLETQLQTALLESHQQQQRLELAQAELTSTEEAYRLAEGRYRAGLGIQLEVLDAEQERFTARQQVINAVLQYNQAQVQLLSALGRVTPDHLLQGLSYDQLWPTP